MAVPYRRKSRTQSRTQRAANMRYSARQPGTCAHCGSPKIPHFACNMCGVYRGRQVRPAPEE